MKNKLHPVYSLYDSVEELDSKAIKAAIQEQFIQLIKEDNFDIVKNFISEKVDWELFTLNTNPNTKLMESNSFLANIIRTHDIELVDYFINLPQYKYDNNYIAKMSDYISYGFEKSAEGDNIKALEYYESLHDKLKMDSFGIHAGLRGGRLGLNQAPKGKDYMYINLQSVFISALSKALKSSYAESDILDFIIQKKDKYGAIDCNLKLSNFLIQLSEQPPRYKKAEYIRKSLGYEYDTKLFKEVYEIVKDNNTSHPVIELLILEKNIPYTEQIKELIKEDIKTQKIFLYRKLNSNLEVNGNASKPKL